MPEIVFIEDSYPPQGTVIHLNAKIQILLVRVTYFNLQFLGIKELIRTLVTEGTWPDFQDFRI